MHKAALAGLAVAILNSTASHAQFNRVRLDSTVGRVGYHLSAEMKVRDDDYPRGTSYEICAAGSGRYSYSGQMPPGIQMAVGGQPIFTGTPRQPGKWTGSLTFWVKCTKGPDQNDYVRTVPVNWSIEP